MIPKFRVWDKKYKEIMKVNQINFETRTACLEADNGDHEMRHTLTRSLTDIELMQSTGLKDKNEVEIFEGDIVRCTVDNWSNGEKFEQIDKVVYEDCMFTFSDGYKYDCSIAEPTYLSKEVIGNIYENPDLLEAE